MSFEHFDRFFTLFAIGLGLFLAGGLNLALGRRGGHIWLRTVATVVIGSAVVAGLAALTRPELAFRAAGFVFGVLLVVALLSSGWVVRQISSLMMYCRKPIPRWGLLTFGGLAVIIGGGIAFEHADQMAIDETMKGLEIALERPPSRPVEGFQATTDRGTRIVLKEPIAPRPESELAGSEERTLQNTHLHGHVIRRSGPADHTNCHGWVFTGGKYLLSPDDVDLIVKENGYSEAPEPLAGDLVVYRQNGAISHTAVVRYITEGQPVLVESKWGSMGVFLHPADKSCYGTEYTFYRSNRQGHLLAGLGSSPPSLNPIFPAVSE